MLAHRFPEAAGVSELDTISRLMEAFRAGVCAKLNRHREDLAERCVRKRRASLRWCWNTGEARASGKGQRAENRRSLPP